QGLVTDGNRAPPGLLRTRTTQHGIGKILEREVRPRRVGRLHPTAQGWIVRGVQSAHAARVLSESPSPGPSGGIASAGRPSSVRGCVGAEEARVRGAWARWARGSRT